MLVPDDAVLIVAGDQVPEMGSKDCAGKAVGVELIQNGPTELKEGT
jgi:hypothetical protein